MKEFMEFVFGDLSFGIFLGASVMMFIGWLFTVLMDVHARDKQGPRSPVAFSIKFFIKDNWKKALLYGIGAFIYIRFTFETTGTPISPFAALGVGGGFELFLQKARDTFFKGKK